MEEKNNVVKPRPKLPRGRPIILRMPEPIPDTPANIVRACMQGPPKKDWNYLKSNSPARKLAGSNSGLSVSHKKIKMDREEGTMPATDTTSTDTRNLPTSPFAKFRGQIELGGDPVDCYVLDNGDRVISLRSTIKAMADVDSGSLGDYIGVKSLNAYINKELVLAELREFNIPGTQLKGKGMTSDQFEIICRAYVQALYEKAPLTDRQREIAVKCAIIAAGLTRTGLDALIDEATGYQYVREEDALQVKLRAFIAEELRAWEKTFPDELWEEFGRMTHWQGSLHSRPKYWGKLVIELIYDTLDPDVAKYLRENRPPAGIRWHQNLTENYGIRQLVSRCYEIVGLSKSCQTIGELRKKVAHHYGKQSLLFGIYDDGEE